MNQNNGLKFQVQSSKLRADLVPPGTWNLEPETLNFKPETLNFKP
jgi:hypothetical protein